MLTIGAVIAFEAVNTAIEASVDLFCKERTPLAKLAKDAGAAGVLLMAAASVAVGISLFWHPQRLSALFTLIFSQPVLLGAVLLAAAASIFFIFME